MKRPGANKPLEKVTPYALSDQGRKDLAESYRVMMGLTAWRHFEVNILARIEDMATRDEDNTPIEDLSAARIAECRGRRKAIEKIRSDVDYIINGTI